MGTLEKIFILHGWTYSTQKWSEFNALLKKEGFEPILLKIPGLTEKITRPWNIEEYINWLDKKIKGEKNPIVLGHSNGGRIALAYAIKHPERLGKLILIDSAGVYHNEPSLRLKRAVFGSVARIGKKMTSSQRLRGFLYYLARENDYKDADPIARETMINLTKVDLVSELHKVTVPTIIIWGRFDKSTPLEDGQLMENKIKNSKLFVLDLARHSPQFTHPNEVVKKIIENI